MQQLPPLILTVSLERSVHDYFTSLRTRYFPAHCNFLEAHLTLFHHLPSGDAGIHETLAAVCRREVLAMQVTAVKSIGNGVAFVIESPELMGLHATLQRLFKNYLVAQDKQKLWPHITIQNKVTAFKAKQTLELLSQDFQPSVINGVGLDSWLYLKGPWQHKEKYLFIEV